MMTSILMLSLFIGAPQLATSWTVSTDDLYSHRLLLGRSGNPSLAMGLESGRDNVVLRSSGGFSVATETAGEEAEAGIQLGPVVRITRLGGHPAHLRYAVAVETLDGAEKFRRESFVQLWRGRGEQAFTRDIGVVFGVQGSMVDNRSVLVLIRASTSKVKAENSAREVQEKYAQATYVVPILDKLPALRMQVSDGNSSIELQGAVTFTSTVDSIIGVDDVVGPGKGKRGARRYHGLIVLVPDSDGHISVVNVAEIDTVLKGVVPSEMYATAALDALKAQAVTARGAVFAKLGKRHFADPFTLCANEHCQVYTGLAASQANTDRAVDQTVGELAFLAGELVDSVYSSTCGGHSENAEVVWDTTPKAALRGRPDSENADILLARRVHPFEHGGLGNPSEDLLDPDLSDETQLRAFLASAPDSFCARASFAKANKLRWQRRISSYDMDRLLFRYGVGHVERLEIQGRGVSGRLRALRIIGDQNTVVIQREWPIRQALGFLNSGAFVVDIERDAKGEIAAFVFNGAGWGHGVGMCQVGAIGMAEAGFDYRAILGHYYNGARVRKIY